MSLCKCKEEMKGRPVNQVAEFSYAPLDSGGHTAFWLQRCLECGGFCGFPQENFELAVRNGNAWTHAALLSEGVPEEDFLSPGPAALEGAESETIIDDELYDEAVAVSGDNE